MKKSTLLFILAVFISFSACSKNNKREENVITPLKESVKVNPEIVKLDNVLSQMTSRFKDEVFISDKELFLIDLKTVLAFEEDIVSDDLPLFFLIDKKHYAPEGYAPLNLVKLEKNNVYNINRNDLSLRPEAEKALVKMAEAAKEDGIKLLVSSTYRSYDYQKRLFQHWVDVDGLEEAERESARPGTSQHQLGLAIDFGSITDDFADTKMGKWMYENASDYGWSLSFPMDHEDVTGYRWESWHFRYVGTEACKFQKKYFNDIQQYMLEFIYVWKNAE